jgi:hypothetical protein
MPVIALSYASLRMAHQTDTRDGKAAPGFLTTRARVLLCVAGDCDVRMRDIAECVGITERTAYEVLTELADQGYLSRERVGRRNCYTVHPDRVSERAGDLEDIAELLDVLRRGRDRPEDVAA